MRRWDDGVMADGDALSPLTIASAGDDERGGVAADVRAVPGGAVPGGPPEVPPGMPVARRRGSRRRGPAQERGWSAWLLLAVLAVQALLTLRLVRADTAYVDEATYLWAGHLEWAHWLHGAPIPPFPAYFSGAPVIYPPLGALADSAGGLAGARVLSLVFMLGVTVLLWGTARRLFGPRAAFFAAALFAVLGPTLHLGAFATYDALRVVLVALAAWCVVSASDGGRGTGWMVGAGSAI